MRTRSFIILGLLLMAFRMEAMDKETALELISAGQQAYAESDHSGALHLFDSVNTHYTSAGLLFNIGNCHFKTQDVPRAILYYERALKLSPGDEDIQANLDLARQQIVDRVAEMPQIDLGNTVIRLIGGNDVDQWARRAIWVWMFTILMLVLALISRSIGWRRILYGLAVMGVIATFTASILATMRSADLKDQSEAIVMTPRLDVRSEPQPGSTVLFVLHKGTKVEILQQLQDWYEVTLRNGSVGWIPAGSLERI